MYRLTCLGWFLVACVSVQAETCALPSTNAQDPYLKLADLPSNELRALLDQYMYTHRWKTHAEAVTAGFRLGDRVYDQVLKSGGKFRPEKTDAWRRSYEKSDRAQLLQKLGAKVDLATVSPSVVDWTLHICLAGGLWSRIKMLNDCRFVFAAGLVAGDSSTVTLWPQRFQARGARCAGWPQRPLSTKGDEVQCVRSGDGATTLELTTDRAGLTRQSLSPIVHPDVPPEPVQQQHVPEPTSEVISLSRSRDYQLVQLGRGCPNCALYAADFRPSEPNAVILRTTTVSTTGARWQACPAGLRCGVYEFSPPDQPLISGCAGQTTCRVWRLAETNEEAADVVQLNYQQTSKVVCANCPDKMDFESAHRQWEEVKGKALARCEAFADLPPQLITREPTN
jgi:hypothetical protein